MTPRQTVEMVQTLLADIRPDCSYDTWYRVAAAIYRALGDDGFDLFDEWSSGSTHKYPGRQGCRRQWDFSKRLDQITIGTLFHYARNVPREQQ